MRVETFRYKGKTLEWVQIQSGRWGLVGYRAEVFRCEGRGWGAMADGRFLGYWPSRQRAMQEAWDMLEHWREARSREEVRNGTGDVLSAFGDRSGLGPARRP